MQGPRGRRLAVRIEADRLTLHAPDLVVLETVQVLRKLLAAGQLTEARAEQAFEALMAMRLQRYPHTELLSRIWALRHNLSAYDAACVALAESLEAPLLTLDARMKKAAGHHANVQVLA